MTMLAHRMGRHVQGLCMATATSEVAGRVRDTGESGC